LYKYLVVSSRYLGSNNKDDVKKIEKQDPTSFLSLNEYLTKSFNDSFSDMNPVIGFILPENYKDESIIKQIMDHEVFKNTNFKSVRFNKEEEMKNYNKDINNKDRLLASVVFESNDISKYTIRVDSSYVEDPTTNSVQDILKYGLEYYSYLESEYLEIFTPIQAAVDQAIIRIKTNDNTFTMRHFIGKLGIMGMTYEQTSSRYDNIAYNICFSLSVSVFLIALNLVKEREEKLKDGLLIAGVHPTVFWLSWYIVEGAIALFLSLVYFAIFTIYKVFPAVNPIIVFVGIFLFSLSACSLSFVLSTFFKRSKTAGTVVLLIYILICFLVQILNVFNQIVQKILPFILSPTTLAKFLYAINDMYGKKFSFIDIFKTDVGYYLLILLLNNVTYLLLAIILDNLLCGENGGSLFTSKRKIKDLKSEDEVSYQKDIQEDFNAKNHEKCMVEVSRVHKIFKGKNKNDDGSKKRKGTEFLAVNDVSFKVYQNEIFALLGHNGAGKTTLINIMVGLFKATYGDVFFDGSSISKNVNKIRKDFGVCAQHNIIYKELTVEDHINFYANLKSVKVDVDEVLRELDLLQQKKLKASKLSGGQKRKLCIAMATIGNPKFIFLDEPTTGLDPLSRRKIWELLLKKKEGRVIFLTTHYMDEADILADRKLILNKGKIRCLGTSLYLKNHFNMKYNLDVETNEKERINGIIMRHLPEAVYIENEEGNEFESHAKFYTWRLPLSSSERFAPLLNELDRLSGSVINKYALSLPTLEELFIRLEDDIALGEDRNNVRSDDKQHLIQTGEDKLPKLKQVSKPSSVKLLATLVKYRLKIFLKDKAFAFSSILLPIILLALTFYFINKFMFQERVVTYKATEITVPSMYHDTKINYASNSTLPITTENIIAGVGNKISSVSNVALNEMVYPKFGENYYLSSVSGSIDSSINRFNFEVHYNDTMPHSVPATFNALSNAYLASKNINDRITVINHPFDERQDEMAIIGLTFIGLMLGMGIVSILSKFGPLSARERINQLLLQLQLNGVSRFNYWISSLITDNSIFLVTCILLILAGVAVRFEPLLDVKIVILIIIFLIIWSIPTMLYQYVISFFFKKEETAYNGISAINTYPVIIGFIGLVIINAKTTDPAKILSGVLYGNIAIIFCLVLTALCPAFGIVALLNALFTLKMYSILLSSELSLKTVMKFENMISPLLILLVILAGVYFFSLMALDRSKNQTRKSDVHDVPEKTRKIYENVLDEGDDDVKREFEYVKQHQNELPISTLHLCKEFDVPKFSITDKEEKKAIEKKNPNDYTYGDIHKSVVSPNKYVKTAVVDVNFGVRTHECFGLLGPNGAGKSTTLNTVTATIPQTMGSICYNGIETHEAKLGEVSMGYCPQHDILWKELTLREHIEFFLSIRGYDTKDAKNYATQYINAAGLEEHQNKRVDDLSGGTKRKLSILIAICGYPECILLDEPTAGMDPSTRRLIWDIVKQTKRMNDSALIMTTHSMEEAEELCDRLAILVNGRLICIGSPEHLKMKFGEGYVLELQSPNVDHFQHEVVEGCRLFNSNAYQMERTSNNRAKYEVKMTRNIGSVFEKMEYFKKRGLVTDYSFNQTSLEQVFINFAKQQIISSK